MRFCPQAKMISGYQNGSVALVISVILDATDHEPPAARLITRAALPIFFSSFEDKYSVKPFLKVSFPFTTQYSRLNFQCLTIAVVVIKECFGNHVWSFGSKFLVKLR